MQMIGLSPKTEQRFFLLWIALIASFFLWSRLDFSSHIYYFGDGNVVVELIQTMMANHDWDPNWARVADKIHQPEELTSLTEASSKPDIFYHMSGYMLFGAAICKTLFSLGFPDLPVQAVLRGFNVFLQLATLLILYSIGKSMLNRYAGLLAATLFVLFPLVVMEAHYERPETWLCFLTVALVYSCLHFQKAPLRYSALIGILIGLSLATKLSQLFLGLMPALLLVHFWLARKTGNFRSRTTTLILFSVLIVTCVALTICIHTPFIVKNAKATLEGLRGMASFYATPTYPYAEEHYSFAGQMLVSFNYFIFTLGYTWCVFIAASVFFLAKEYLQNPASGKITNLVIVVPVLFIFIYSALQVNFVERTFSSIEGILCLMVALGAIRFFQWLNKFSKIPMLKYSFLFLVLAALFYKALVNDYLFVQRYIKHPDKTPRILFQESLKNEFQGFWIKNVYFAYKVTNHLPEKPAKTPRIYQIDDLNEHWTKDYLGILEKNGFIKVGSYCSDFYDMPQNTLTIYHGAAKNHYYVREDEWPANVPTGYFKTNCQ